MKILLTITLPEETINSSEARKQANLEEYLLIEGLPIPSDYWRFWTRQRILRHLLTDVPNEQMTLWLNHLKDKRVIESWDCEKQEKGI